MEASFSLCLNYGSMAKDRSKRARDASDASGVNFRANQNLETRRNVASYDCRSDVSAGLPGIAYVTHPRTVRVYEAYAEETFLGKKPLRRNIIQDFLKCMVTNRQLSQVVCGDIWTISL